MNLSLLCQDAGLLLECPSSGSINSEIVIIGDYPGQQEVETKRPFEGSTGNYLFTLLRNEKLMQGSPLHRNNVYLTNAIKRRVLPSSPITHSEMNDWRNVLFQELDSMPNLKYILILGSNPMEMLLNVYGISNQRGGVFLKNFRYAKNVPCLVTFNPASVLKKTFGNELANPKNEVIFKSDLKKFGGIIANGFEDHSVECEIIQSYDQFRGLYNHLLGCIQKDIPISIDTEHLNNETCIIGFATDVKKGLVIPFYDNKGNHTFTFEQETLIRLALSKLFQDKRSKWVGQNAITDTYWMALKDRLVLHRIWFDTMLGHHLLYPQYPHNLGFLVSYYTNHPYYKDDGSTWKDVGDYQKYLEYNAKDCALTLRVQQGIEKDLIDANLLDFFHENVMLLEPELAAATIIGVKVDTTERRKVAEQYLTELQTSLKSWQELVADVAGLSSEEASHLNPSSFKQMNELLFSTLKIRSAVVGTGEDAINEIRMGLVDEKTDKILQGILDIRSKKTILGFLKNPIDADGRFRTEFKNAGTITAPGRLSSATPLTGRGGNLQNQPPEARRFFIADPGFVFGYGDSAQAEARVVGWKANIDKWIEDFERARLGEDFDCHRSLAAEIFNIPYDQVPVKDEIDGEYTIRFLAKRARHGLNYRLAAFMFAIKIGIPFDTAKMVYDAYHRVNPEIKRWWAATINDILGQYHKNGYAVIYNAFGRRKIFIERMDEKSLDSVIAFYPQSTVGDLLKRALRKSHADDRWPDKMYARILINVHDSLTVMSVPDKIKTCLAIMKEHAEEPMMINGKQLIIPFDLKMSVPDETGIHRWSNMKGIKL